MLFSSYDTLYDIYSIERDIGGYRIVPRTKLSPRQSASTFYDLLLNARHNMRLSPSDRARAHSEIAYYRDKKPFYNLYPGVDVALSEISIDFPLKELKFPFESFTINFHRDTPVLFKGQPLRSIFVSAFQDGARIDVEMFAQYGKFTSNTLEDRGTFRASFSYLEDDEVSVASLIENSVLGDVQGDYDDFVDDFKRMKHNIFQVVIGVAFMAISKDKSYVQRTVNRVKGNELCFCGSGKKYKVCCSRKGEKNVGYAVGAGIYLPKKQVGGTSTIVEGRGKALQYGHVRSGHMRWQWYNDEAGNRVRKLIFIHPTIVRPDLPLKPQLTPRQVKKPPRDNPFRLDEGHTTPYRISVGYSYDKGRLDEDYITAVDESLLNYVYDECYTEGCIAEGWGYDSEVHHKLSFYFGTAEEAVRALRLLQQLDVEDLHDYYDEINRFHKPRGHLKPPYV